MPDQDPNTDFIAKQLMTPQPATKKAAPVAQSVSPIQKLFQDIAAGKPANPAPKPPKPTPPPSSVGHTLRSIFKNVNPNTGKPNPQPVKPNPMLVDKPNREQAIKNLPFSPEAFRQMITSDAPSVQTKNGEPLSSREAMKRWTMATHSSNYLGGNPEEEETKAPTKLAPNNWAFRPNESIPDQAMKKARSFIGGLSANVTDKLGSAIFGAPEGWHSLDPESEDARRGQEALSNFAGMFIPGLNALQGAEFAGNTIDSVGKNGAGKAGTNLINGITNLLDIGEPKKGDIDQTWKKTPTEAITDLAQAAAMIFGGATGATHLAGAVDRLHPDLNVDLERAVPEENRGAMPDEYKPQISRQAGGINPNRKNAPARIPKENTEVDQGKVNVRENVKPKAPRPATPEGVVAQPGYMPPQGVVASAWQKVKTLGGANIGRTSPKALERADLVRAKEGEIESNAYRNKHLLNEAQNHFDRIGNKNFKDKYEQKADEHQAKLTNDVNDLIKKTETRDPDYFKKRAIAQEGSEKWNKLDKDSQKRIIDQTKTKLKPEFVDKLRKIQNYQEFDKIENPEKLADLRDEVGKYDDATKEGIKKIDSIIKLGKEPRVFRKKELGKLMDQYGDQYNNTKLVEIADTMRPIIDKYSDRLDKLGKLNKDNYIENYYPHQWEDQNAYKEWENQSNEDMAKRKLTASSGFLKARKYNTFAEGMLDENGNSTGNFPKYKNPVEGIINKLGSQDRYITGQNMLNRDIDTGNVQYLANHAPLPQGYDHVPSSLYDVNTNKPKFIQEFYDKGMRNGLENLAKKMGIDLKSTSKFKDNGTFGESTKDSITTRGPYEGLLMHEIAHNLNNKFGLEKKLSSAPIMDELKELSKLRYHNGDNISPSFRSYTQEPGEMVANLIHGMIHTPELVESIAPNALEKVQEAMSAVKGKDNKEIVNSFRDLAPSLEIGKTSTKINGNVEKTGSYIMPKDQAAVVAKYLSPGLDRNEAFNWYRRQSGFINNVNLGMSLRHASVTALQAAFNDIGLGARQLLSGNALKGAENLTRGLVPGASYYNSKRLGKTLVDHWLKGIDSDPATKDILKGVVESNLGFGRDPFYGSGFGQTWHDAWKSAWDGSGIYKRIKSIPSGLVNATQIERVSNRIMHNIVPMAKLGTFSKLLEHELSMHEGEFRGSYADLHPEEFRRIASEAANLTESVFGELRYSSLLLDNKFKDVLLNTFRATGYNLGTGRIFGRIIPEALSWGGKMKSNFGESLGSGKMVKDVPGATVNKEAFGKQYAVNNYSHNIAYTFGMVLGTYWYSSLLKNAMEMADDKMNNKKTEWKWPGFADKEFLHIATPWKDDKGNPESVSLPTYLRDAAGFVNDPKGEISAKLSEPIQMGSELLGNKQYTGEKIFQPWNTAGNIGSNLYSAGKYGLMHALPFTLSNVGKPGYDKSTALMSFFGLNKSPSYMTNSSAESLASQMVGERMPSSGRTPEEMQKTLNRRAIIGGMRDHKPGDQEWKDALNKARENKFTDKQIERMVKESRQTKLQNLVQYLDLKQSIEVLKRANTKELDELKPIVGNKLLGAMDRNTYTPEEIKQYIKDFKKAYGLKQEN